MALDEAIRRALPEDCTAKMPGRHVRTLMKHPEMIGKKVGFKDLTAMHGEWIREMVYGEEDYTLQAHRGSYKSSCLAVAIAMMMVIYPRRNIIFLRKTDDDVAEMMRMVSKILHSDMMRKIVMSIYGRELTVTQETTEQISTGLWLSPMGAPQLLGMGIRASITGKHAYYVITDDICNKDDRSSRAERERTKTQYDELQNIRNRGGRIINLGTPWHREDVFCKMPNIHRYDCYTTGLIRPEKLEELRQSMPPYLFAANYELRHIASEDAVFKTPPVFIQDETLIYNGKAHVDAAYGGKDYTAFTCARRLEDGTIVMYGRLWQKDVTSVLDQIVEEAKRLRCGIIYCEDNWDHGFLRKEMARRGGWGRNYRETQNKVIKIETYLRQAWEKIRFLEGTDREYITQILDYTEYAEHDDAPDSAATVCRYFATYRWEGKRQR